MYIYYHYLCFAECSLHRVHSNIIKEYRRILAAIALLSQEGFFIYHSTISTFKAIIFTSLQILAHFHNKPIHNEFHSSFIQT